MTNRPLRVAFLTPWRIDDEQAWSGIVAPMYRAIGAITEVVPVSTHDVQPAIADRALARAVGTLTHSSYLWDFGIATSVKRGRAASQRLRAAKADVVFAVAASVDIAFLRGVATPVVQYVDATFEGIRDRYPVFARLNGLSALQIRRIGRAADRRTSRFVAASQWARDTLARDHAIGTEACTVAPPGAAVLPTIVPDRAAAGPLHALVVSSDWVRKGGAAAVRAVESAREHAVEVDLTVIGDSPDDLPAWIRRRGRLTKQELSAEYAAADVLLELAEANAAGVTLTDAAAHGLPVIATATMGVPSIVRAGKSGWLIEPATEVATEAERILSELAGSTDRTSLGRSAREWYDCELDWDVWAERVLSACRAAVQVDPHRVGLT